MALMLPGSLPAFSADDDLPPPIEGTDEEIPLSESPPQMDPDETLPTPSLGQDEDELPDPYASRIQEKNANQVNRRNEEDDIFLPTPAVQDNVNYAPLGSPVSTRTRWEDNDWYLGMQNRPAFSLQVGVASRNYLSELVPARKQGPSVAASWRAFNIAQTVFLHAYASASFFNVGDVAYYQNVKDFTLHFGPLLEVGIGRRLSLYASFLRRSNTLSSAPEEPGMPHNEGWLTYVDEPASFRPGFGLQWDFYVIPHGSLGVRGHFEQDYAVVYLTMAIEPKPSRRLNLNFRELDR